MAAPISSTAVTVADPDSRLREELDALIAEGTALLFRFSFSSLGKEDRDAFLKGLQAKAKATPRKSSKSAADRGRSKLTEGLDRFDFASEYQPWYSRALKAVEQLLPDRYDEFRELYRVDKRRSIDVESYGISDAIRGITVTRLGMPDFDTSVVTTTKIQLQLAIVKSARDRLDFLLSDIRGVLEAGLFDHELAAAEELLKAGHLRSAGVVAGVVLERHLQRVVDNHKLSMRRKPTIANLNDALKTAGVIDVPKWRHVQLLGDLRNLCAHNGDRDPAVDEVKDLLTGVTNVIKTTF